MAIIKYNGSIVATVEDGNTATLPVKDLKMKSDIVVMFEYATDKLKYLEEQYENVDLSTATKIKPYCFAEDKIIKTIEMPNVATIGNNAFENCSSLALTSLPNGLTNIGKYAFSNCRMLALTELPSGITSVGEYTFEGCTNLALTELPSGVIIIGNNAFEYCTNLALTELPSGLTSMGSYAFRGCTNLALTELPSGVTSIGGDAFYGCTNLALTALPSGVTSIGLWAFRDCANLALTELPSGLTKINDRVFQDCLKITLTELPSGLTSIGSYAFEGCTGITSLTFKSKPTSISSTAFYNCTNLTTINVPWAEGEVAGAPWGATNATIHYMTFTINGTSYQMENRMTWYAWTRSEYNTDGFSCASENDYVYEAESSNKVTDADGNDVLGTTYIVEGGAYLIKEAVTEDELAGTWVFNASIDLNSYPYTKSVGKIRANPLNFTCEGVTFRYLSKVDSPIALWYQNSLDSIAGVTAYYNSKWMQESHRTIIVSSTAQDVSDEFFSWLKANATKIA